MKKPEQFIFGIGILGIAAVALSGGYVAAVALSGGYGKKKVTAPSSTQNAIVLSCNPASIKIIDEVKTNQLLVDIAKNYIGTLKKVEDLSYVTLVGNTIKKLNSSCYDLYSKQKFTSKDQILIIAYLSISVQNAFKIAYFGDIINLKEDQITPEIKSDYDVWKNFQEVINPEKVEEVQKFIGYSSEMDNELENVKQIILVNDQYPA